MKKNRGKDYADEGRTRKILSLMRDGSYAPMTSEELVDALGNDVNPNKFWDELLALEQNGEIIKHALKHTACRRKWAWLQDAFS